MAVGVKTRTGARSYLDLVAKACKLSHFNGFRLGLANILGPEEATALFTLWDPFCAAVDLLIATDDWYNQKDFEDDDGSGEDTIRPS